MMIPRRVPAHLLRLGDVVLFGRRRVHITYAQRLLGSEFFTKLGGFRPHKTDRVVVKLTIDSRRKVWVIRRDAFFASPHFPRVALPMLEARVQPLEIQNRVRTNA